MILSLLIFLPLFGSLLVTFLPESQTARFRWIALTVTLAEVILAGLAYAAFDPSVAGYQLLEETDWITLTLGILAIASIDYKLCVDVNS